LFVFKECHKHLKEYSIRFNFQVFESNTDPVKTPILVVDKKYIPEADAKSINEINYSVQCSMLRGHTFFNLDLQNEITGQETHFSICFCPLEYAGNNELYGRMVGFINIYKQLGFLMVTSPESLDKLNGKTGEQIANMVVNGEINNLAVLGKFDISPIETTNNIWIKILKYHSVLKDLNNFDIFHKVLIEMDNKFLNLDTRVFCKSCEAIFKEI